MEFVIWGQRLEASVLEAVDRRWGFALIGVEHRSLAVEVVDSELEIAGRFGSGTVFAEKQVVAAGFAWTLFHLPYVPFAADLPFFGKAGGRRVNSFKKRGGLIRSVDPVEVVFVYQRRASLTGEKWWVSTHFGHSWLGSDNAILGGVGIRALDPFGPGERVTLGRGLVNQRVAPLVEVSGPFFVAWVTPSEYPRRGSISLYSPQSSL
ncbi:unnamed protein product [Victoria cruziana]